MQQTSSLPSPHSQKNPNGGLIVAPSPLNATDQDLIIALAVRLHLPAIYPFRYFCTNGGLVSYGSTQSSNIEAPRHTSIAS